VPLALTYSPYAFSQLSEIKAKAEAKPQSAHGAQWSALKRLLTEVVPVEDHAFGPATALRGALASVKRAKAGRTRLFFLASREKQKAIVLMLGFRKEGDRGDAYEEIARRIRRGEFAAQFAEIGIEPPDV
jgi:hypothetical protein